MHGYFMDIRLYRKAKLLSNDEPFNFEEYKKRKIKEKIEKDRSEANTRVKLTRKLPAVNTELAKRLIEDKEDLTTTKKVKAASANLLEDKRFSELLFSDPNYQIDPNSEEFKLLNPVVQKVNEKKLKKSAKTVEVEEAKEADRSDRGGSSSDDDDSGSDDSSSDDEHTWSQQVKKEYKEIQTQKKKQAAAAKSLSQPIKQPKFFEIKEGLEYYSTSGDNKKLNSDILRRERMKKLPLSNRLQISNAREGRDSMIVHNDSFGNKQMTFMSRKAMREKDNEKKSMEHHMERKAVRRSAGKIVKTLKTPNKSSNFFKKTSK